MEFVFHQPVRPGHPDPTNALREAASVADGVELDVRLSRGQLVIAHDRRDAHHHPLPLREALDALRPTHCHVLLDVKSPEVANPLGELLATTTEWPPSRATISGEPSTVELVSAISGAARAWTLPTTRRAHPAVPAGLLGRPTPAARGRIQNAAVAALRAGRADAFSVDHRFVTESLTQAVHAAGGRVLAWTVNDPAAAARLANEGVDALITDRPAELRRALAAPRHTP